MINSINYDMNFWLFAFYHAALFYYWLNFIFQAYMDTNGYDKWDKKGNDTVGDKILFLYTKTLTKTDHCKLTLCTSDVFDNNLYASSWTKANPYTKDQIYKEKK